LQKNSDKQLALLNKSTTAFNNFKPHSAVLRNKPQTVMFTVLLFLDNLGGGEILVVMLFILFFFGSKKVPDMARSVGKASRMFKDALSGVQNEIENSMQAPPPQEKKEIAVEEPKIEVKEPENSTPRSKNE
jgi:sec-independent protein translocase protein TatA